MGTVILKRLLEGFLSPIGILAILLGAGLCISAVRRQSRLGHRLLLAGAGLYFIFVFTPLAELLIAGLERSYPALLHPDPGAGIQATVVLSGYGEENPTLPATSKLSPETICRMAEGIRLYRNLPGTKLILSGGILRKNNPPVASLMAEYAKDMGVPENDIVTERRSLTTYENLVELHKILGGSRFLLVTSACDLRRALAVAHRLGMQPLAAPACIWSAQNFPTGMPWPQWIGMILGGFAKPSTQRLGYIQLAYHEHLGYLWYWMLGRV